MSSLLPFKLVRAINRFSESEKDLICRAYFFARAKHRGQTRKSGASYIIHPLRVATRLANDNYDAVAVTAALLHDTLEDTSTTYGELVKNFNSEVADIVDAETKVAAMRVKSKNLAMSNEALFLSEVDNYRKLLLAMCSDIRVIIIRLYDRLDNVASLELISPEKRGFYARETIEIYASIAERLGMGVIKGELQDLCFPYAYPKEYQQFAKIAKEAYKNPQRVIAQAKPKIKKALDEAHVNILNLEGRTKHLYSLYVKMTIDNKNISEIFDIAALRIIVHTISDCYKSLGIIHNLYKPLPGRIKDYIAQPKTSGYQSIHTTVKDNAGNIFEVQIRTEEMHEIAEYGPAAHWNYKDLTVEKNLHMAEKNRNDWLLELKRVRSDNNKEFLRQLKEEFFGKQVFVFTPKGKVISLPKDASGIDFAYRIHTQLGNTCSGIKINNRIMPLRTALKTGDVVEILSSPKATPSRDWLKIVKTSYAKHHIKSILRERNFESLAKEGERIILSALAKARLAPPDKQRINLALSNPSLPYNDIESAYVAVAERILNKTRLIKILYPDLDLAEKHKRRPILSENIKLKPLANIRHLFSGCCRPKASDKDIMGYISRDHIIKVHKTNCRRIVNVDKRRLIEL